MAIAAIVFTSCRRVDGAGLCVFSFCVRSVVSPMSTRRQKFWGWGWEDEGPTAEQRNHIAQLLAARFHLADVSIQSPPRLEEITLRPPRLAAPSSLAHLCSQAPYDRAAHSYGKSFRDVVRAVPRA